ncbi:uncharacterized protein LOC121258801 [Juglans microcarpa x Juglans regia]|uniref:uncharacterized protein LOC121258801 n=1 Tax=Juglans microcarpa x Juglans regia TaxID=2249226 RepID=UPI001B7EE50E|nr:uncharacterized protein LOC121258801 [Juglans microcarpa x Juglans regia]
MFMPAISTSPPTDSIKGTSRKLLNTGDLSQLERLFPIAWAFWYRQNKLIYEQLKENLVAIINHALSLQNPTSSFRNTPNSTPTPCWNVPPTSFFKLNVDGALFYDNQKAGVGAVVRDDHGQVIMAVSKTEPEVSKAESVELLAMLRGLQFSSQMGLSKIILESDSLILVEALQVEGESLLVLGNLISEVKRMLHQFQEAKVQHVPRMGNQVAHCLARHAWRVQDVELWMHSFPDIIAQHVWLDNSLV